MQITPPNVVSLAAIRAMRQPAPPAPAIVVGSRVEIIRTHQIGIVTRIDIGRVHVWAGGVTHSCRPQDIALVTGPGDAA
jgi:hypothetical protein